MSVNKRFAKVIIGKATTSSIRYICCCPCPFCLAVWVNDHHLVLLFPTLRTNFKLANVPIGFFLHVAFPFSEIFRCLSVRGSLSRGLLAADRSRDGTRPFWLEYCIDSPPNTNGHGLLLPLGDHLRTTTFPLDAASLRHPSSLSGTENQMRALQVVTRLRQPFGALLLTLAMWQHISGSRLGA